MSFALSYFTTPSLLLAPQAPTILAQWAQVYHTGKLVIPPIALLSAACSLGNAYALYHPRAPFRTYAFIAAAVPPLLFVPWTLTAMGGTNAELLRRRELSMGPLDEGAAKVKEAEREHGTGTRELVERWAWLNYARTAMLLAATYLSFEAL